LFLSVSSVSGAPFILYRRWLKYEEKVEVGGRWSKPHVSTASLHALLEIRRAMTELSCTVELDVTSASGSLADVSGQ